MKVSFCIFFVAAFYTTVWSQATAAPLYEYDISLEREVIEKFTLGLQETDRLSDEYPDLQPVEREELIFDESLPLKVDTPPQQPQVKNPVFSPLTTNTKLLQHDEDSDDAGKSEPKNENANTPSTTSSTSQLSLVGIPICFVCLFPFTFIVCYIMALKLHLIKRKVVHMCETGAKPPSSRLYQYGLVTCGALIGVMGAMQFTVTDPMIRSQPPRVQGGLHFVNALAFILGSLAGLNLAGFAVIDLSVFKMHTLCTGLFAFFGLFYMGTFTLFCRAIGYGTRFWNNWRLGATSFAWLCAVCMFISNLVFLGLRKLRKRKSPPHIDNRLEAQVDPTDIALTLTPEPGMTTMQCEEAESHGPEPLEEKRGPTVQKMLGPIIYRLWAMLQYGSLLGTELFFVSFVSDFARMRITATLNN